MFLLILNRADFLFSFVHKDVTNPAYAGFAVWVLKNLDEGVLHMNWINWAWIGGGLLGSLVVGLLIGRIVAGIKYPNPDKPHIFTPKQSIIILAGVLIAIALIVFAILYQPKPKNGGEGPSFLPGWMVWLTRMAYCRWMTPAWTAEKSNRQTSSLTAWKKISRRKAAKRTPMNLKQRTALRTKMRMLPKQIPGT